MKKLPALAACLLGMCLAAAGLTLQGQGRTDHLVEVVVLDESNWDEFVPEGKEVDAIYGDIVIRNGSLVAVIAAPSPTRNANMTVRDVGGCLIDLTERDAQSDQLSAYYPGRRDFPYRSWSVEVDGRDATAEATGGAVAAGRRAAVTVTADGNNERPGAHVTYRLNAADRELTITSSFENTADKTITFDLIDDVRADGGKEDMQKAPNGTGDLFWIDDRYWQQAYGVEADGRSIRANSDARTSTLRFVDKDDNETVKAAPGESVHLARRIAPGRSLLDVRSVFGKSPGTPVSLLILDAARQPVADSRIDVHDADGVFGTVTSDERGRVEFPAVPGTYSLNVSLFGNLLLDEAPLVVHADASQSESIVLEEFHPGRLIARVTDAEGQALPCKVEFKPQAEGVRLNFGPETGEFAVGNLRYAANGRFEQVLLPGRYDLIVSHGPEYDAVYPGIEIEPGEREGLDITLERSVDTTGWVSSDFHSHSSPSGDNTSSQLGRVLNLVCEHIEFAPCTEHNRISTYDPHIARLGIADAMATCSGMELTGSPLLLNHQNAFPLIHHHHHQDGGGPVTDGDPQTQIERLALWDDRSEKLVQQNHPDIGWLVYDRDGDHVPDEGHARSVGLIDVMEIHPIDLALDLQPFTNYSGTEQNHRIFNWLQLLNQGLEIPGVTNTDAHYNYHGSGWLRIWIKSPTDNPADIETLDMVHAAEEGRVLMSNGPFLEVQAREAGGSATAGIGDELSAGSGKLLVDVRVQCANWLDIDHVFLLVNGRRDEEHNYTRAENPDAFADGVVKFERTLQVAVESDAHLIVVCGHHERTLEPVYGGDYAGAHPTAISNPIYVDVDGGGFQANKDTLGSPLPVKRP